MHLLPLAADHRRTQISRSFAGECRRRNGLHAKKLFPQVQEFFFDDDTFTANLPRAREIAKKLAPLGLTWSCNSRANLDYDTIKLIQGLRPAPVPGRL